MLSTADADEDLRAELRAVSEEWRGTWPERGFTMAMDALFRYPDTVLAVAVEPDGRSAASCSSCRRRRARATRSRRCAAARTRRTG